MSGQKLISRLQGARRMHYADGRFRAEALIGDISLDQDDSILVKVMIWLLSRMRQCFFTSKPEHDSRSTVLS